MPVHLKAADRFAHFKGNCHKMLSSEKLYSIVRTTDSLLKEVNICFYFKYEKTLLKQALNIRKHTGK